MSKELEQYIDSFKFKHFKGSEFTPYWSRTRGSTKNSPPPKELWPNFIPTLVVLDALRASLGVPIIVTSSYRSNAYNKAVGGASSSFHKQFKAADIQARGKTASQVHAAAKALRGKTFKNPSTKKDFIFRGGIGKYPTFVHIDTRGYDADF